MDDRFFKGNQSNDIGVTVITPYGGDYADSALRLLSAQESSVIVKLPNDSTFLDEITESIKIYKFLNKNASGARGNFDSIRRAKVDERIEKKDRIRIFIEDALKNADIYVNGDKATISAKEPVTRINEALGKLVAMKYNKLTYMETAPELSDISAIFKHSDGQMSFLGTSDTTPNKLALEEVVQVIGLNNARHMKTSLKSLQDKFGAAPYGFDPKDVQWLVAMLFKLGRVSLTLNSQSLSLLSTNSEELVRYIKLWAKSNHAEKVDVNNGLLLCPNHDKLFDRGYISFDNGGHIVISDELSENSAISMNIKNDMQIELSNDNIKYMEYHRNNVLK